MLGEATGDTAEPLLMTVLSCDVVAARAALARVGGIHGNNSPTGAFRLVVDHRDEPCPPGIADGVVQARLCPDVHALVLHSPFRGPGHVRDLEPLVHDDVVIVDERPGSAGGGRPSSGSPPCASTLRSWPRPACSGKNRGGGGTSRAVNLQVEPKAVFGGEGSGEAPRRRWRRARRRRGRCRPISRLRATRSSEPWSRTPSPRGVELGGGP